MKAKNQYIYINKHKQRNRKYVLLMEPRVCSLYIFSILKTETAGYRFVLRNMQIRNLKID